MLHDVLPANLFINQRGGQLKTWMITLKEDRTRLSGPGVFSTSVELGLDDNRDRLCVGPLNLGKGCSGRGCCHECQRNGF